MLRAEKIQKIYRDGKRKLEVLKDIDLEIKKGERVAVVGPSGAGKSTLLHILGGIDRPSAGKIFFNGVNFCALQDKEKARLRNQKIGFVFQFYHLLPEFTALENAMMPAIIQGRKAKLKTKDLNGQTKDLMCLLGLEKRLFHRPNELSGGEQQRVAIARAIINNPEVLLCDEPTGNLDSKMGEEILKILFDLNKRNQTTIVIVTHDKEIAKHSGRIIEIKDGKMV